MVAGKTSEPETVGHLLRANERVLWSGKPVYPPFVLSSMVTVLFGLVWLIIPTSMVMLFWTEPSTLDSFMKIGFQLFLVPFFLIGVLMLLAPVYNMLLYRFVEYVVTNQRVILRGGLVGRDIKALEFDQIRNIGVEVSLVDKLYGTGRIRFFTGEIETSGRIAASKYDTFHAIHDPYAIFKVIQDSIDRHRSSR